MGELIALFWAHNHPDGPPFGATLEEIQDLFSASSNSHYESKLVKPLILGLLLMSSG